MSIKGRHIIDLGPKSAIFCLDFFGMQQRKTGNLNRIYPEFQKYLGWHFFRKEVRGIERQLS